MMSSLHCGCKGVSRLGKDAVQVRRVVDIDPGAAGLGTTRS